MASRLINEFKPNTIDPTPLSASETKTAYDALYTVVKPVKGLNRRYVDPVINDQKYGLLTFIPARDAKPNSDGFYGYVKLRGNYSTIADASARSAEIIKNVDSTNPIYTCVVGSPVPLVVDGFAEEKDEIDVKKHVEEDVSANVRNKMQKARREIEEIKEREEELKRDVAEPDPQDEYNSKRTKLAVLRWTIIEHQNKIKELTELRNKCVRELVKEQHEHPDWERDHLERYMAARKKVGMDQELTGFMTMIGMPIVVSEEGVFTEAESGEAAAAAAVESGETPALEGAEEAAKRESDTDAPSNGDRPKRPRQTKNLRIRRKNNA